MRLAAAKVFALSIPFVERFRHSAQVRAAADGVLLRLSLEDGTSGWGEGLARPYVTGERVGDVLEALERVWWPALAGADVRGLGTPGACAALLDPIERALRASRPDLVAASGSRCAVELALLDLAGRARGESVAAALPPTTDTLTYAGVIEAAGPDEAARQAARCRVVGLTEVKVKVGLGDDVARVAAVREALGWDVALRVDANGAWTPDQALRALERLAPLGVAVCEQPLARGDPAALARVQRGSPVPLMADESLVTQDDARALLDAGACAAWNVRVAKHGGLGPALAIARLARAHGVEVMVGAHVGETSLLAAAGRHLAAHVRPRWLEGSLGTLLLEDDVTARSARFGHRGLARPLTGPGLGVEVDEDRVRRWTAGLERAA